MAAVSQIMAVLRPWLGPSLCASMYPAAERICVRFSGWSERQSLDETAAHVREILYGNVKHLTGSSLLVFPAPGQEVRMCDDDFDVLTDEVMFLLFDSFPADEKHLGILEEYAQRSGSLSALRKIYVSFRSLISPYEAAALKKVILGYPAFRLGWLRGSEAGGGRTDQ